MIIHPPEMIKINGEIILSSEIEFAKSITNIPNKLWFSFPEDYEPYITLRGDAFLLGALVPAMYYREDIEIRTPISPRLAYNLNEFMFIYHKGFGLPLVNLKVPSLKAYLPAHQPKSVAVGFSGGVDSLYTLYCNLPKNQPITEAQITHGLLVQGFNDFDIALTDREYFERVYTRYLKLFARLGLTLLIAKTNAYQFAKFRINWTMAHIPTQVAFPYLLGNLIARFYRATDGDFIIYGEEDPFTLGNHLLSNETLQVVSHTSTVDRVEKLIALSQWDEARENLRVCLNFDKKNVELNCSKCLKCTQNMVLLEIIGEYDNFKAFVKPYPWYTVIRFWWLVYGGKLTFLLFRKYAKKYKRYDILFWAYLLHFPRGIKTWLFNQVNKRLSDDMKYRLREKVYRQGNLESR